MRVLICLILVMLSLEGGLILQINREMRIIYPKPTLMAISEKGGDSIISPMPKCWSLTVKSRRAQQWHCIDPHTDCGCGRMMSWLLSVQLAWVCLLNLYAMGATLNDLLRLAGVAPRIAVTAAALCAVAVLAAWLLLDIDTWGWIPQDLMGVVYVIFVLRLGILPNLKVPMLCPVGIEPMHSQFPWATKVFCTLSFGGDVACLQARQKPQYHHALCAGALYCSASWGDLRCLLGVLAAAVDRGTQCHGGGDHFPPHPGQEALLHSLTIGTILGDT